MFDWLVNIGPWKEGRGRRGGGVNDKPTGPDSLMVWLTYLIHVGIRFNHLTQKVFGALVRNFCCHENAAPPLYRL